MLFGIVSDPNHVNIEKLEALIVEDVGRKDRKKE